MSDSSAVLTRVAEALADGTPVDWDAAFARAASPAEQEQLNRLREFASVWQGSDVSEDTPDPDSGPDFGGIQLQERIGRGGFGEVYRAWDRRLRRHVAVKLLEPRGGTTTEQIAAVLREARTLARIRHPNVLSVFSVEQVGERIGICTELVEGRTLAQWIEREGACSPVQAAAIAADVCRGLHAVHEAGVVHGDVKPQNVIQSRDGRIVLADFGGSAACQSAPGLVGTPLWLAPELFEGHAPSAQSDIYAAGLLVYYLTAGKLSVPARSLSELAAWHRRPRKSEPSAVRGRGARAVGSIAARATACRPEERFACAADMASDLDRVIAAASRRTFATVASALAAAAVVLTTMAATSMEHALMRNGLDAPLHIETFAIEQGGEVRGFSQLLEETLRRSANVTIASAGQSAAAELRGTLLRRHSGYVVVARLRSLSTSGGEREIDESFSDSTEVPAVVRRLAARVATLLGRPSPQLSQPEDDDVTTSSRPAARFYHSSQAAAMHGNWDQALILVTQALREDPAFPIAHAWRAWCLQVAGRPDDARNAIASAKSLESRASGSERLFIDALDADLHRQKGEAIAAYEAFLNVHPDVYWAVQRLIALEDVSPERITHLLRRTADEHPLDFDANLDTARSFVNIGDLESGRRYIEQVRAIEQLDSLPRNWWVAIQPAFDAWLRGQAGEAARLLDEMSTPNQTPLAIVRGAAEMNLALGRLRAAEALVRRLPHDPGGDLVQAFALANRVPPEPIPVPVGLPPRIDMWIWLLADSGQTKHVMALIDARERTLSPASPGIESLEGLRLALRHRAGAITVLSRAATRMPPGTFQALVSAEAASRAAAASGDLSTARRILELATVNPVPAYANGAALLTWLRTRIALADFAGRDGDHAEAAAIVRQLQPMVAGADSDFAPAQRLAAIASSLDAHPH